MVSEWGRNNSVVGREWNNGRNGNNGKEMATNNRRRNRGIAEQNGEKLMEYE